MMAAGGTGDGSGDNDDADADDGDDGGVDEEDGDGSGEGESCGNVDDRGNADDGCIPFLMHRLQRRIKLNCTRIIIVATTSTTSFPLLHSLHHHAIICRSMTEIVCCRWF